MDDNHGQDTMTVSGVREWVKNVGFWGRHGSVEGSAVGLGDKGVCVVCCEHCWYGTILQTHTLWHWCHCCFIFNFTFLALLLNVEQSCCKEKGKLARMYSLVLQASSAENVTTRQLKTTSCPS